MLTGVAAIEDAYGPISGLVNAAGIFGNRYPVEKVRMDNWDREINIDLRGTFLVDAQRRRTDGAPQAWRDRQCGLPVAGMTSGPIHAYTAARPASSRSRKRLRPNGDVSVFASTRCRLDLPALRRSKPASPRVR